MVRRARNVSLHGVLGVLEHRVKSECVLSHVRGRPRRTVTSARGLRVGTLYFRPLTLASRGNHFERSSFLRTRHGEGFGPAAKIPCVIANLASRSRRSRCASVSFLMSTTIGSLGCEREKTCSRDWSASSSARAARSAHEHALLRSARLSCASRTDIHGVIVIVLGIFSGNGAGLSASGAEPSRGRSAAYCCLTRTVSLLMRACVRRSRTGRMATSSALRGRVRRGCGALYTHPSQIWSRDVVRTDSAHAHTSSGEARRRRCAERHLQQPRSRGCPCASGCSQARVRVRREAGGRALA